MPFHKRTRGKLRKIDKSRFMGKRMKVQGEIWTLDQRTADGSVISKRKEALRNQGFRVRVFKGVKLPGIARRYHIYKRGK